MENKYTTSVIPTFCPGCGNFGIMSGLKMALSELKLPPYQVAIGFDVGCNANMADFIKTNIFRGLHGRSVPPMVGVKLANHDLTVLAVIGDGGFYGEGSQHFLSLMRGNHDITVLVHDNQRYSLTTGQMSPTTPKGTITPSTPEGSLEEPINPLAIALVNHGTFIARGYSGNIPHLKNLIIQGIKHRGFSLIEIFQPCVIWNKQKSYDWYQKRIYNLEDLPDYKNNDRIWALHKAQEEDNLGIGIFFQENKKAYHEQVSSLVKQPLAKQSIEKIDIGKLLEEFK